MYLKFEHAGIETNKTLVVETVKYTSQIYHIGTVYIQ